MPLVRRSLLLGPLEGEDRDGAAADHLLGHRAQGPTAPARVAMGREGHQVGGAADRLVHDGLGHVGGGEGRHLHLDARQVRRDPRQLGARLLQPARDGRV